MRAKLLLLPAIAGLILCNCGQNGGPQKEQPPRIVCFGDSLTAGRGLRATHAYPAELERILRAEGFNYEVINAGVSGETTAGGVMRIETVLRQPVAILIVELGVNEILRHQPLGSVRRNLALIISRAQAVRASVVLAGVELPSGDDPGYQLQVSQLYSDLAADYKCVLIPLFLKDVYAAPGAVRADGIHPNGKGARILAQTVYRSIQPLLVRRP